MSINTNLTAEELERLKAIQSEDEWNKYIDSCILALRGGSYPPDWYVKVIASGLIDKFGGLEIHTLEL